MQDAQQSLVKPCCLHHVLGVLVSYKVLPSVRLRVLGAQGFGALGILQVCWTGCSGRGRFFSELTRVEPKPPYSSVSSVLLLGPWRHPKPLLLDGRAQGFTRRTDKGKAGPARRILQNPYRIYGVEFAV